MFRPRHCVTTRWAFYGEPYTMSNGEHFFIFYPNNRRTRRIYPLNRSGPATERTFLRLRARTAPKRGVCVCFLQSSSPSANNNCDTNTINARLMTWLSSVGHDTLSRVNWGFFFFSSLILFFSKDRKLIKIRSRPTKCYALPPHIPKPRSLARYFFRRQL